MSSSGVRDTTPAPPGGTAPGADTAVTIGVAAIAGGAISLIIALVTGGAVTAEVIPGLPDSGPLTRWGLPVSTMARDLASALTLGLLVLAVFLLPLPAPEDKSEARPLGAQALGYVRAASWAALCWAAAAAATLVFQLSDISGLPPQEVMGNQLTSYAVSVSQGISLLLMILAATALALFCRTAESASSAAVLVVLAAAGMVPPVLTGHSASAGAHELAVAGLALHVLAIAVWVGGLAAVTFHGLRAGAQDAPVAAERFSRMALWAYAGVAVGGVASAVSRLYEPAQLFTTSYGLLILVKIALFAVLGAVGYVHRRATVPRITETAGRRLFARLAGVEIVVMAAAMALGAALSRTPPPPDDGGVPTPAESVLGFPMPPPISAQTLLTLWRPDLFFAVLVAVMGGLYIAGVVRLRRRGDSWPAGRLVAWLAGLLLMTAVLLSGVATYSMVLFSTHMVQHMLLSMMAPVLLVLGAPVTLALRALRPARRRGDRGPREWLNAFLNSRFSKVVTHPGVATPLFVFSPYVLYFTPLFGMLMSDHSGHVFMNVHFLLSGYLYYWTIVGVDPGPRRLHHLLRILLLLLAMGVHAFFGITIMMQTEPLAMSYYGQFDVPWADSVGEDQYAGGGVAWAIGEIPTLLVMLALLRQWAGDEERRERRRERHSRRGGSDDADMDAYNAYLQELDRRARAQEGPARAERPAPEAPAADQETPS
ncbi:cytochrome c oxidase assembly protein [Streptomonospora nanhaiensis]|uniref:cytochrome c oxidase assembly protein n=1 Tax=Streptomonospora nanhaiensis TaxID=1323731 RepID=UPI001C99CD88|nr:bifunctional copper resistance protein CopD/cytochrome c oxidase assembly protein [Streptomonospora nanhaiensis]